MSISAQETGKEVVQRSAAFAAHGATGAHEDASPNLTTPRIREAIAVLFGQGRSELAAAVGEAAISLYPYSEDILVMCSLMAEAQQDWEKAEKLLVRLIEVQGADAPAVTWLHLLRVLRCQGKVADATMVADFASTRHQEDKALSEEIASLRQALEQV